MITVIDLPIIVTVYRIPGRNYTRLMLIARLSGIDFTMNDLQYFKLVRLEGYIGFS